MVTGEPFKPVRHTWAEVHERARRAAGGLAAAGVNHGDAVGVLAGAPVEIAPTAQGLWMRGASITMLHQPTPRTDLMLWAEDTGTIIDMIAARTVIVSDPFIAAIPVLEARGINVVTIEQLLAADPIDPVDTDEDDVALMQLTSGSTGSPKAVQITHRNLVSNAEAMFVGAEFDMNNDVIVSWLPLFHDMGMTGFLTVPMYFGAELVKVTPMDFLSDTLLWARLIDKYKGTMTAAPNFAYSLFAKRLRRQAYPGEYDLSSLRWALSGAEQVEPADVEDLIEAGEPFGLRARGHPAGLRHGRNHCGSVLLEMRHRPGRRRGRRRPVGITGPRRPGRTTAARPPRLATLGPLLDGLEARVVDEHGELVPPRAVGVIEVRGEPVHRVTSPRAGSSRRRTRMAGTTPAIWVTSPRTATWWSADGSRTSSSWPAATSTRPTSNEPPSRVDGVRPGCAVAVRLDAGMSRESFSVAVESKSYEDPIEVRRIKHDVAHEVVADVGVRPRNVVVLGPGVIPKTPSGKLRRAHSLALFA